MNMMSNTSNTKFKSIQVLRGCGALSVALYHCNVYLINMGGNEKTIFKVFNEFFSYGAILFFAISGYLMASSINNSSGNKTFLVKRLARIYPSYILTVIMVVFIKVSLFSSITQPDLLKSITLLPFGVIVYPLGVEWTLIYEIFFYFVCWPFNYERFKDFFSRFLLLWMLIILITSLKFNLQTSFLPTINNIFFAVFNFAFIFGGLFYYLNQKMPIKSLKLTYIIIIINLIVIYIVGYYSKTITFFGRISYFIFGIGFSCIIYAMINNERISNINYNKYIIALGDYSYGLYLIHVPVITIIFSLFSKAISTNLASIIGIIAIILSLVAGVIIGRIDVLLNINIINFLNKKM